MKTMGGTVNKYLLTTLPYVVRMPQCGWDREIPIGEGRGALTLRQASRGRVARVLLSDSQLKQAAGYG